MFATLVVIAGLAAVTPPVLAHHSYSAYDGDHPKTFKDAKLTEVRLIYPHSILAFETKDEKGNVETWAGEMNSPAQLSRMVGFKRSDFTVGNVVTIVGIPSRTGQKYLAYSKIIFSDGREFVILAGNPNGGGGGRGRGAVAP
jgi:hypothetical protein